MTPEFQEINSLTLIIPTFQRQDYLLRQILYLSDWNVEVIIVDGSLNRINKNTQQLIDQNIKINYYHLNKSYAERVQWASAKINTEFVMCLAEDDFYLKSGIEKSIKKLKENVDAVACMGNSIGLDKFLNKYYVFEYGNNLMDYTINQDSPKSRIAFGFDQYRSATPYAVYKTKAFRNVWSSRDNVSCLEVVEYENTINALLQGKLLTSNSLYWIRSFETIPIPSNLDGTRKTDFNEWYNNKKFLQEKESFKKRVKKSFKMQMNLSTNESELFYNEVINKIISRSQSSLVSLNTRTLVFNKIVNKFKSVQFIVYVKDTLIWKNYLRPLIEFLLRDKIKYIRSDHMLNKSEIKKVLIFANSTKNMLIKEN